MKGGKTRYEIGIEAANCGRFPLQGVLTCLLH